MSHYRVINSKIMNIIFCPYEEQYDHGKEPRGQLQKKGVQVFFKKIGSCLYSSRIMRPGVDKCMSTQSLKLVRTT